MMERKPVKGVFKYIFGGMSGMSASLFVQPLDLVKTRMQISGMAGEYNPYTSTYQALRYIVAHEGFTGLYTGLDAALLRQATYTTTRLGVYSHLNELFAEKYKRPQKLWESLVIGFISGGCGAFIGTPSELALIRLTTDARLPPNKRRNYTGVINALLRIVREEGIFAIFKGSIPTMTRAMVVNTAQLASYTQFKYQLLKLSFLREGVLLQFCASLPSGFITTLVSIPIDMAKTRIQNQLPDPLGNLPYRGTVHAIGTVIRDEGMLALWKGFIPYFARIVPHTVLTFIFLEQLTLVYSKLMVK